MQEPAQEVWEPAQEVWEPAQEVVGAGYAGDPAAAGKLPASTHRR